MPSESSYFVLSLESLRAIGGWAADCAERALELAHPDDATIAEAELRWAIGHASTGVREVLLQMPAREPGKSRLDGLLYALDASIRKKTFL